MTRAFIILCACALLTAGCSGPKRGGGYYKDDGPGRHTPANIDAIPDAVPRIETHAPANMRPYVVFGKRYTPITSERPFRQTGIASWYGRKFHGNKTANGEIYDMYAMTAAHPTLPLPSYARVTHARTGKSVVVRINDRGPFHSSRIIDLSYVAAAKLDLIEPGSGPVIVEAITHEDIRSNAWQGSGEPAPKAMPIPDAAPPPARSPTLTVQASPDTPPAHAITRAAAASSPAADTVEDPVSALLASAAPPEPTEVVARASGTSQVFLQYGAFSTHENAHRLAGTLNQEIAHIEARRAQVTSSAGLHRVKLGPYASRAQAVNAALRIESATGRQATYTTRNIDVPNTKVPGLLL